MSYNKNTVNSKIDTLKRIEGMDSKITCFWIWRSHKQKKKQVLYSWGTPPPDTRTERHSAGRTVLIGPLLTSYEGARFHISDFRLGSKQAWARIRTKNHLSCVQFWARGMECRSFYDFLGKKLLSTEAEGAKAQAELILERQLGLHNKHVELQKNRDAEDRNRTREQGCCSNQFFSLVFR